MTAQADQYGSELRNTKGEISELKRMISRLQNEIQAAVTQVSEVKNQVERGMQKLTISHEAKATLSNITPPLRQC